VLPFALFFLHSSVAESLALKRKTSYPRSDQPRERTRRQLLIRVAGSVLPLRADLHAVSAQECVKSDAVSGADG